MIWMTAIGITNVGAERGYLDLLGAVRDDHDAELRAYSQTLRKQSLHTIRRCVGCHVIVGGLTAKQNVAHTSAHEIGLVACSAQGAANAVCKLARVHKQIMREKRRRWKLEVPAQAAVCAAAPT